MPPPSPQLGNTSGTSISQRFGYYFVGIAIGLVLLGFFMSNRQRAVKAQQTQQQSPEQQPQSPSTPSTDGP